MILIDASLVCLESLPNFHDEIQQHFAFFCGGNLAALHLKCIIAHKTLFSSSFRCENTATEVPYSHGKNPKKFRVWCAMAH